MTTEFMTDINIDKLVGDPLLLDYAAVCYFEVVPIKFSKDIQILATYKDVDPELYKQLRFLLKREILFYKISNDDYMNLLYSTWTEDQRKEVVNFQKKDTFKAKVIKDSDSSKDKENQLKGLAINSTELSVIQSVDDILSRAATAGASDIHFEPAENHLAIRFRLDGVLQPVLSIPKYRQNEFLSRLKILAQMDIAEKRRPQDGRIVVEGKYKKIDIRVSSLPTHYGEKIVLRLLDKSQQPLDLKTIGMGEKCYDIFCQAIRKPYGMILITGPTGSGKTTTLYAALKDIHSTKINISTVEDPVEYQIEGINQTQMHSEIGYTFANAVKTFLRQDPDVIMIGEIRDPETAKHAIQAAQTGHLVFSTLHTNDAPSAVVRLLEMDMEPFLVASTVHLIIAQRLIRKVCENCSIKRKITSIEKEYCKQYSDKLKEVKESKGCKKCSNTGYKGRTGVFEMMEVTPEIQELVTHKAATQKIREIAVEQGMSSLKSEAFKLVENGITTINEMKSVVG